MSKRKKIENIEVWMHHLASDVALDSKKLHERIDRLEDSMRSESVDKGQTWWRHPETDRRMVVDHIDKASPGDIFVAELRNPGEAIRAAWGTCHSRRILRPAKLYPGGPTGWCVEVGKRQVPKKGDWYLHHGGPILARLGFFDTGSDRWKFPMLEPLPKSEFAAHGREADRPSEPTEEIHVVFDNPPSQPAPRFVEVEDQNGRGVRVGEWQQHGDYWHLVIPNTSESRLLGKAWDEVKRLNTRKEEEVQRAQQAEERAKNAERERDEYREGWKLRGRIINDLKKARGMEIEILERDK